MKRMRQPRYLIGAVLGGAYFAWYLSFVLFRPISNTNFESPFHSSNGVPLSQTLIPLMLMLGFLSRWVIPGRREALAFSETELAWLLPAPMTRRQLILFKLAKSQRGLLLTTLVFSILGGRIFVDVPWLFKAIAILMMLQIMQIHSMAASFTLARLAESGKSPLFRRILLALPPMAVAVALALSLWHNIEPFPGIQDLDLVQEWFQHSLNSWPFAAFLVPFSALIAPTWQTQFSGFFIALLPVVGCLILHVLWLLKSAVAFEEASLQLAQKQATLMAAVREGKSPWTRFKSGRRPPFPLKPVGPAPMAFLWKNLLQFRWSIPLQRIPWILLSALLLGYALGLGGVGSKSAAILSTALVILGQVLFVSLFLGSQLLRMDFRMDFKQMDQLKVLPVPGWQVALGQIAAPLLILTTIQYTLLSLIIGIAASGGIDLLSKVPTPLLISILATACLILPVFNLVSILVPNAAILLFPAWQSGTSGRMDSGFDMMGQRFLAALAQYVVLLCVTVPAVILFLIGFFPLLWWGLPALGIITGGLLGAAVWVVIGVIGIQWLGRWFDRFDMTHD